MIRLDEEGDSGDLHILFVCTRKWYYYVERSMSSILK